METWRRVVHIAKIRSRRKRLHDEIVYDQLHHHPQQQQQQLLQHHDLSLVRQVAVNGHKDGVYLQQCLVCYSYTHSAEHNLFSSVQAAIVPRVTLKCIEL